MPDQVLRLQSILTARDHLLLQWLVDHGVFTTPQLAYALFPSLDFAQHRLTRLTTLRVVDRFRPFRPDGGSYPFHYVLDQLGIEVVAAQRGQPPPRPGQGKANRRRWTAARTLGHRLGVNGFFTDLAGHARTHPDHALTRWWPETRCAQPGAFIHPGSPGDPVDVLALATPIRPDGHGIWTAPTRQVPFFLEYDTGTEPLTELMRKLIGYARLTAAGGPRWPVLFWLHSAARARHLHQHLAAAPVPVPVATASRDQAVGIGPAGPLWHLHGRPGLLTLADLATTGAS
ncbi:replication-relaxation family protein [Micromonospora chersina]|uniref:replication-relaxation family protein n=1 Tax=Micromonospora chersina TaxID=47854 RepID=UPI0033C48EC3